MDNKIENNQKYVIKTDRGYLRGDIGTGLDLVQHKKDARVFGSYEGLCFIELNKKAIVETCPHQIMHLEPWDKLNMPDPTEEDLSRPLFKAIDKAIDDWNIGVPKFYDGNWKSTDSHTKIILDVILKQLPEYDHINNRVINSNHHNGTDEMFGNTFDCPKCVNPLIFKRFKYCPECGIELVWDISTDVIIDEWDE